MREPPTTLWSLEIHQVGSGIGSSTQDFYLLSSTSKPRTAARLTPILIAFERSNILEIDVTVLAQKAASDRKVLLGLARRIDLRKTSVLVWTQARRPNAPPMLIRLTGLVKIHHDTRSAAR